jgi:hypothetical protein
MEHHDTSIEWFHVVYAIVAFIVVSLGGILIGLMVALVISFTTKFVAIVRHKVTVMQIYKRI